MVLAHPRMSSCPSMKCTWLGGRRENTAVLGWRASSAVESARTDHAQTTNTGKAHTYNSACHLAKCQVDERVLLTAQLFLLMQHCQHVKSSQSSELQYCSSSLAVAKLLVIMDHLLEIITLAHSLSTI